MLTHIGQGKVAETVHNAWFKTIEDGIHTGDIYREGTSREKVGTEGFTKAVIARLGKKPDEMKAVMYPDSKGGLKIPPLKTYPVMKKDWIGFDVFVESKDAPDALAAKINAALPAGLTMAVLTNRGVKTWPNGSPGTFCTDHWGARIKGDKTVNTTSLATVLLAFEKAGIPAVKVENLYTLDGKDAFTAAAG
jgi:isocitrate dehydrogenase